MGTFVSSLRLAGSTASANAVDLLAPYLRGSRSRGPGDFTLVLTHLAKPGQIVKKGDEVAAFDNENMRNRLDDLTAERVGLEGTLKKLIADRKADWEQRQQAIRVADGDLQSARLDLSTASVRPELQAESYRLSEEEAAKQLSALQEQEQFASASDAAAIHDQELQAQETQLEERRTQMNLDHLVVPAPIGGMVVMRDIVRGDDLVPIQNGDQLSPGQPYMQIVDTASPLIIEAKVNQVDVEHLKIGLPVRVGFDGYPDVTMNGTVQSVAPLAESGGFRRDFVAEVPVTVKLQQTDTRIVPGLSAAADVVLARDENAEIVPRQAIFDDANHETYAFVQSPHGWEKCSVQLGLTNNIDAEVRPGLTAGEVVALKQPKSWTACDQTTTQQPGAVHTASR